jgi:hypothetical protein
VSGHSEGIWVSNACPKIDKCVCSENEADGIWVTSYQYPSPIPYPVITWDSLYQNGENGIYCMNNKARISYTGCKYNEGWGLLCHGSLANPVVDHSKLTDNGAGGVRAETSANPILGKTTTGEGQYNSIYGSQPKYVWNATTTPIYAQNCWWGSAPPNQNKFYGTVYTWPYLTGDPVTYLASRMPEARIMFSLAQNFPNPFNKDGVTTIGYSIPTGNQRVVLAVYDVAGRRVKTLVSKTQARGSYVANWDGRNERGEPVAAGIYFYKLSAGGKSMSKKLIYFR